MKNVSDTFYLYNGMKIPCVGYGTWQTPNGKTAFDAGMAALNNGYRHIDTAAIYGNEESVGQAVKESGISRKQIFVTSKLWNTDQGYDSTLKAFDLSLKRLGLDYLDLYLIHWPCTKNPDYVEKNKETWKAFERLYKEGKVKAIGVSNFFEKHLTPLMETAEVMPMVDQIEVHPGCPMDDVVAFCNEHHILVEAWSPLMSGKIFDIELLKEIANKYNKTVSQIVLRWDIQRGILPLPKSLNPSRMIENTEIFDFEIKEEDMEAIKSLSTIGRTGAHPDEARF